VDELDRLRLLVGRDVGAAVLDDVVGGGGLAVLQHHDRLHALRPFRVGHADDGGIGHGRVLLYAALDLGRVDVLGRRLHHPGLGTDERDGAVRFAPAEIAGVVPAAALPLGVHLGPVPVPVHDRGATADDLAGVAD